MVGSPPRSRLLMRPKPPLPEVVVPPTKQLRVPRPLQREHVRAVPLVEPADVRVHVPRREYLRDLQILRIGECTERLPRSASAGGHLPMALERVVCHIPHDVVPGNTVHVADEQRAEIVGELVVQLLPRRAAAPGYRPDVARGAQYIGDAIAVEIAQSQLAQ